MPFLYGQSDEKYLIWLSGALRLILPVSKTRLLAPLRYGRALPAVLDHQLAR
jgi:hypothetical protein